MSTFLATHSFTGLAASLTLITRTGAGNVAAIDGTRFKGEARLSFRIAVAGKGLWLKRFKGDAVAATRGTAGEEFIPAGSSMVVMLDPDRYDGFAIIDDGVGADSCRGSVSVVERF